MTNPSPSPESPFMVEVKALARRARRALPGVGVPGGGVVIDSLGRRWNPALHPRDSRGRFIETGGLARLGGGRGVGRIVRVLPNGKVELRMRNGARRTEDAGQLTMLRRPNGAKPTRSKASVTKEDARRAENPKRGDGVTKDDLGDRDKDGIPDKVDATPDGDKPKAKKPEGAAGQGPSRRKQSAKPQERTDKHGFTVVDTKVNQGVNATTGSRDLYDPQGNHVATVTEGVEKGPKRWKGTVGNQRVMGANEDGWREQAKLAYVKQLREGTWEPTGKPARGGDNDSAGKPAARKDAPAALKTVSAAPKRESGEATPGGTVDTKVNIGGSERDVTLRVDKSDPKRATSEGELFVATIGAGKAKYPVRGRFTQRNGKWELDKQTVVRNRPALIKDWNDGTTNDSGNRRDGSAGATPEQDRDAAARMADAEARVAERKANRPDWLDYDKAPAKDRSMLDLWLEKSDDDSGASNRERVEEVGVERKKQVGERGYYLMSEDGERSIRVPKTVYDAHTAPDRGDTRDDRDNRAEAAQNRQERAAEAAPQADTPVDRQERAAALAAMSDEELAQHRDRIERGEVRDPNARQEAAAEAARRNRAARQAQDAQDGSRDPRDPVDTGDENPTPQEDDSERNEVREDRGEVLADLPADSGGRDAGPDGVLRGDGGEGRAGSGRNDGDGGRGAAGAVRSARQGDGDDAGQDGRGGDGAGGRGVPGAGGGDRGQGAAAVDGPESRPVASRFRPTGQADLAGGSQRQRVDNNIAALRTLRTIQSENRPATPEEQAVLARWGGWGAIKEVFDERKGGAWETARNELRTLLPNKEEWNKSRENALNAHYTDTAYVDPVWDALRDLGFDPDGANVLEPGAGSGNFIGRAPDGVKMTGVEQEGVTAGIAQALYPDSTIRHEGFEDTNIADGTFDAAVGNVPFGRYSLHDSRHNKAGYSVHNHFILKSLALTKPGGIVALHTSRFTLDSKSKRARKAREDMFAQADLIGAVRLPGDAHKAAAGTPVITDLLVFRKRRDGETPGDDSWLDTDPFDTEHGSAPMNRYFHRNPDHVIGQVGIGKGQYSDADLTVTGDPEEAGTGMREALRGITRRAAENGLTFAAEKSAPSPVRTTRKAPVTRKPRSKAKSAAAAPGRIDPLAPPKVDRDKEEREGRITWGDEVYSRTITHGANGQPLKKPRHETTDLTVREGGEVVPMWVPKTQVEEIKHLTGLSETFDRLLAEEARPDGDESVMDDLRAELNERYDAYLAKFGPIGRYDLIEPPAPDPDDDDDDVADAKPPRRSYPTAQRPIRTNPAFASIFALEGDYDRESNSAPKSSIFTTRAVSPREIATTASNGQDALALSMERFGRIDMPEIAKMLGTDEAGAARAMRGLVFTDPETGRVMDRAEFLSGNVRSRLRAAREKLDAGDESWAEAVEALAERVPDEKGAAEIYVYPGAPWIPASDVQDFANEMMRLGNPRWGGFKVENPLGSRWKVTGGARQGILAREEWGTERRPFGDLLQLLLTQSEIKVMDKVDAPDGGKRSVLNVPATEAAQNKAEAIAERFAEWLWENPARAKRLHERYNDLYRAEVIRSYDGSPERQYPGMADGPKRPMQHQTDGVTRIVGEQTSLLAHVVGAGKTMTMQAGSMELRRLGLAKKPAHIIPNHMLEQYTQEFKELYPGANILAVDSSVLKDKQRRRSFLARAASGDWDAVVFTQESFKSIPMSREGQTAYLNKELDELREARDNAARAAAEEGRKSESLAQIELAIKNAEARIKKLLDKDTDDGGVNFEALGIDYLFVDEAHHYKNLRTVSRDRSLTKPGSQKATDLHMKLSHLRDTSESGRVATFATGTPIANSISEAYVMQKYLRPDLLEKAGIKDFDSWIAMFGERVTDVEMSVDGNSFKSKTRIAKFRNAGEMIRMWAAFADVKRPDDLTYIKRPDLKKNKDGDRVGEIVTVPRTEEQSEYIVSLGERADMVKAGNVDPSEDNMLKISSDGRKAAMDLRLLDRTIGAGDAGGKTAAVASRVAEIYHANKDRDYNGHPNKGGLQIVFADLGTPKDPNDPDAPFSAYDDMRAKMIEAGIPASKIAYIHDASTAMEKDELFKRAKSGEIAVLFGSTEKMGTGTNVQNRALALHHVDVPWRPADLEQRDGRVIRQGNLNSEVEVIRYVTEGTFDAYMWSTVERKAGFIEQVYRADLDADEIEDVGDAQADYAQVKAIASGNPLLVDQAFLGNEVRKLRAKDRAFKRGRSTALRTVNTERDNQQVIRQKQARLAEAERRNVPVDGENFKMTVRGQAYGPKRKQDAGQELAGILRDTWVGYWPVGTGDMNAVGEYGGHKIYVQRHNPDYSDSSRRRLLVGFDFPDGMVTLGSDEVLGMKDGSGLIQRLDNRLNSMPAIKNRLDRDLDASNREIEVAENVLTKDFAFGEDLRLAERRMNVLNELLKSDTDDPVPSGTGGDGDPVEAPEVRLGRLRAEYSLAKAEHEEHSAKQAAKKRAATRKDQPDTVPADESTLSLPDEVVADQRARSPRAPAAPREGVVGEEVRDEVEADLLELGEDLPDRPVADAPEAPRDRDRADAPDASVADAPEEDVDDDVTVVDRAEVETANIEAGADLPDRPADVTPEADEAPEAPGLDAAERRRLEWAAQTTTARYARMGDPDRYVAEGELRELVDKHGLPAVRRALRDYYDANPDLLTEDFATQDARAKDRQESAQAAASRLRAAVASRDVNMALEALGDLEEVDPDYRIDGDSLSTIRRRLESVRQKQLAGDAPDAPEAPSRRRRDGARRPQGTLDAPESDEDAPEAPEAAQDAPAAPERRTAVDAPTIPGVGDREQIEWADDADSSGRSELRRIEVVGRREEVGSPEWRMSMFAEGIRGFSDSGRAPAAYTSWLRDASGEDMRDLMERMDAEYDGRFTAAAMWEWLRDAAPHRDGVDSDGMEDAFESGDTVRLPNGSTGTVRNAIHDPDTGITSVVVDDGSSGFGGYPSYPARDLTKVDGDTPDDDVTVVDRAEVETANIEAGADLPDRPADDAGRAALVEQAKKSRVPRKRGSRSSLYGGVSGPAADQDYHVATALVGAAKDGKTRYIFGGANGFIIEDRPNSSRHSIRVTPDGRVTEIPALGEPGEREWDTARIGAALAKYATPDDRPQVADEDASTRALRALADGDPQGAMDALDGLADGDYVAGQKRTVAQLREIIQRQIERQSPQDEPQVSVRDAANEAGALDGQTMMTGDGLDMEVNEGFMLTQDAPAQRPARDGGGNDDNGMGSLFAGADDEPEDQWQRFNLPENRDDLRADDRVAFAGALEHAANLTGDTGNGEQWALLFAADKVRSAVDEDFTWDQIADEPAFVTTEQVQDAMRDLAGMLRRAGKNPAVGRRTLADLLEQGSNLSRPADVTPDVDTPDVPDVVDEPEARAPARLTNGQYAMLSDLIDGPDSPLGNDDYQSIGQFQQRVLDAAEQEGLIERYSVSEEEALAQGNYDLRGSWIRVTQHGKDSLADHRRRRREASRPATEEELAQRDAPTRESEEFAAAVAALAEEHGDAPDTDAPEADAPGDNGLPELPENYEPRTPAQMEGEAYPLNPYQQVIADDVVMDEVDVVAAAKAGTGKTTTAVAIARRMLEAHPKKRGGYLAFNKSVKEEAVNRMPRNVEALTGHGAPFRWRGSDYTDARFRKGFKSDLQVANHLGIEDEMPGVGDRLRQAWLVTNAVSRYSLSADDDLGLQHFTTPDGDNLIEGVSPEDAKRLLGWAKAAWGDIDSDNGALYVNNDHIRKMWALARPDFSKPGWGFRSKLDFVVLDEAQDTPPVLAKVLADQKIQRIILGDSDQAIYGSFTGSVDFMQQINPSGSRELKRRPLPLSYRYGPEIADAGNRPLQINGSKERVIGAGGPGEVLVSDPGSMTDADAVLVRSNAGMLNAALRELENDRIVGVPQGTKANFEELIASIRYLRDGGRRPAVIHEDLARFEKWSDFEAAVEAGDDPRVAMLERLLQKFSIERLDQITDNMVEVDPGAGNRISSHPALSRLGIAEAPDDPSRLYFTQDYKTFEALRNLGYRSIGDFLYQHGIRSRFDEVPGGGTYQKGPRAGQNIKGTLFAPEDRDKVIRALREQFDGEGSSVEPDVFISTVHKAKGLEWDRVRIGDDFRAPSVDMDEDGNERITFPDPEEQRIAYVAFTRAGKVLDPGGLAWVFAYSDPNGGDPNGPRRDAPEADASEVDVTPERDVTPEVDVTPDEDRVDVAPEQVDADRAELGIDPTPEADTGRGDAPEADPFDGMDEGERALAESGVEFATDEDLEHLMGTPEERAARGGTLTVDDLKPGDVFEANVVDADGEKSNRRVRFRGVRRRGAVRHLDVHDAETGEPLIAHVSPNRGIEVTERGGPESLPDVMSGARTLDAPKSRWEYEQEAREHNIAELDRLASEADIRRGGQGGPGLGLDLIGPGNMRRYDKKRQQHYLVKQERLPSRWENALLNGNGVPAVVLAKHVHEEGALELWGMSLPEMREQGFSRLRLPNALTAKDMKRLERERDGRNGWENDDDDHEAGADRSPVWDEIDAIPNLEDRELVREEERVRGDDRYDTTDGEKYRQRLAQEIARRSQRTDEERRQENKDRDRRLHERFSPNPYDESRFTDPADDEDEPEPGLRRRDDDSDPVDEPGEATEDDESDEDRGDEDERARREERRRRKTDRNRNRRERDGGDGIDGADGIDLPGGPDGDDDDDEQRRRRRDDEERGRRRRREKRNRRRRRNKGDKGMPNGLGLPRLPHLPGNDDDGSDDPRNPRTRKPEERNPRAAGDDDGGRKAAIADALDKSGPTDVPVEYDTEDTLDWLDDYDHEAPQGALPRPEDFNPYWHMENDPEDDSVFGAFPDEEDELVDAATYSPHADELAIFEAAADDNGLVDGMDLPTVRASALAPSEAAARQRLADMGLDPEWLDEKFGWLDSESILHGLPVEAATVADLIDRGVITEEQAKGLFDLDRKALEALRGNEVAVPGTMSLRDRVEGRPVPDPDDDGADVDVLDGPADRADLDEPTVMPAAEVKPGDRVDMGDGQEVDTDSVKELGDGQVVITGRDATTGERIEDAVDADDDVLVRPVRATDTGEGTESADAPEAPRGPAAEDEEAPAGADAASTADAPAGADTPEAPEADATAAVDAPETGNRAPVEAVPLTDPSTRGRIDTRDLRVGDVIDAKRTDGTTGPVTVQHVKKRGAHDLVTGTDPDGNTVYARLNKWGAKIEEGAPDGSPSAWDAPEPDAPSLGDKAGSTFADDLRVGDVIDGHVNRNGRSVQARLRVTGKPTGQGGFRRIPVETVDGTPEPDYVVPADRPVNVTNRAGVPGDGPSRDAAPASPGEWADGPDAPGAADNAVPGREVIAGDGWAADITPDGDGYAWSFSMPNPDGTDVVTLSGRADSPADARRAMFDAVENAVLDGALPMSLLDDPALLAAPVRPARVGDVVDGPAGDLPSPEVDTPSVPRDALPNAPESDRPSPDVPTPDGTIPSSVRRVSNAPEAEGERETPAEPPADVNGRRAQWRPIESVVAGDLIRAEGTTADGTRSAAAGYAVDSPVPVALNRDGSRTPEYGWQVTTTANPDGTGKRSSVITPADALVAYAPPVDGGDPENGPETGNALDVLNDRLPDVVPNGSNGVPLFPGALVKDSNGREGMVAGATDRDVTVMWEDGDVSENVSPTAVSVTDAAASIPTGWDKDGRRVSSIRDDEAGDAPSSVGSKNAGDLGPEDHIMVNPAGAGEYFLAEVIATRREGDEVVIDLVDTRTGEVAVIRVLPDTPMLTSTGGKVPTFDHSSPNVEPEAMSPIAPTSESVGTGGLLASARRTINGLGYDFDATADPTVADAAARVRMGRGLTADQASKLAAALRAGGGDDLDRAAAADALDAIAARLRGDAPTLPEGGKPTAAFADQIVPGDRVAIPEGNGEWTVGQVVGRREVGPGLYQVDVAGPEGVRSAMFGNGDPIWKLGKADQPEVTVGPDDTESVADAALRAAEAQTAEYGRVIGESVAGALNDSTSLHQAREAVAQRLDGNWIKRLTGKAAQRWYDNLTRNGLVNEADRAEYLAAADRRRQAVEVAARQAILDTVNDVEALPGESWPESRDRMARLIREAAADAAESTRRGMAETSAPSGDPVQGRLFDVLDRSSRDAVDAIPADGVDLSSDEVYRLMAASMARRGILAPSVRRRFAESMLDVLRVKDEDRQTILGRLLSALARLAKRVAAWLKKALAAFKDKMGGAAWKRRAGRVMSKLRSMAPGTPEWAEVQRIGRGDGPDLGGLAVPGDGPDLPTPGGFGMRLGKVEKITGAALKRGEAPTVTEGVVPDTAADGGPGRDTLSHLDRIDGAGQAAHDRVRIMVDRSLADVGGLAGVDRLVANANAAEARFRQTGEQDDLEAADAARAAADAVSRRAATAHGKAFLADMKRRRKMGSTRDAHLSVKGGTQEQRAALRWAEQFVPTDWLEHVKDKPLELVEDDHGWYDPATGRMALADLGVTVDGQNGFARSAMHELWHHIEAHMPDLQRAQGAYHFRRTSTGEVGSRQRVGKNKSVTLAELFPGQGYSRDDRTREDDFANPYAGVEYGNGQAWELLTAAAEELFAGDGWVDDDTRYFMLGLIEKLAVNRKGQRK